jgi:asparagine synthase (glutamine-hydrolysing)
MCGILTVARTASGDHLDLAACRRALSRLSWRGPDLCVSSVWDERVFLGQTVLSLTGDVTGSSGAYARSKSGRYAVAFNGELYNFRELAARYLDGRVAVGDETTDTEVLVNLHDVMAAEQVPALLDGMYAYTVLDQEAQQIYVARDPQGEKSLFIHHAGGQVIVASEIPAILALHPGLPLDTQALRDYFRTRHYMLFERTAFQGIRQLLPGRLERLDLRDSQWSVQHEARIRDWIDPDAFERNRTRSLEDLADELDALLAQSVSEMLPERRKYAAVVSGGVDSSLLGHYLVERGSPDVLVAVDHIGKDQISSDLSGFEQTLGRRIHVLHIDEVPYAAEIVRCQQTCGGPLGAHSFVPQSLQSAHVRSAGCRILFGGEGGDEYFGGYDAYLRPAGIDSEYSPSPYLTHQTPEVAFVDDRPELIQDELRRAWADALDAYAFVPDPAERATLAMLYGDAAYQLPAVGLRGADLMSMMWSLETRTVLIRRAVAAFALNLPVSAKLDAANPDPNRRTKILLKKLFLRYFPGALLVKKQGFAGFPNESAAYLGAPEDYLAHDVLGMKPAESALSRAALWKLTNVEYFLRSRFA